MKLQQPLTALLLAFAATISAVSVGAQDEVKQDVISDRDFIEVYTEGEFEDERSQKSQEAEQPVLNAVNFDEFSAVAEEEVPTPPPATEIVGGVKYDSEGMIILGEGQTYELKTGKEFQKFQTDNEIIKAENDSMHKIFVTGKALGTANLHIYFTDGSSQSHSFRVKSDSDSFTSIIKQLFPTHKLEIVPIRDTAVFLRGTVETEAEVQQIEEIAGEFWPTVHNHIQAMQPEMQAVYSDKKSEGIPNGMRVITVPVVDWV